MPEYLLKGCRHVILGSARGVVKTEVTSIRRELAEFSRVRKSKDIY